MTQGMQTKEVAREVMASLSSHVQIPTFSSRPGGLTLTEAYQVTSLLRTAFESRGERITGRKIGFTNRQMWEAFGVSAPVWGYVTSHTVSELSDQVPVSLSSFCEARIEPEIIFGLGATPAPDMSETELIDCIEWVALGYEIVQSIFPDWNFKAADTVAANGLHGALLIGKRYPVAQRKTEWQRELATFEAELFCNGQLMQRGGGALVLDSPVIALRHLIGLLGNDPVNPPLRAGELVSTGTLTLALTVKPGERWTTRVHGIPLDEMTIQFQIA